MSENRILKAIADKVKDDRLHFQIIIHNDAVHIYINRDTDEYIDYRELTDNICSAIAALEDLNLVEMGLYSRILGEVEPDWETFVELTPNTVLQESVESMADEIISAVEKTDSLIAQIEQEFEAIDGEDGLKTSPEAEAISEATTNAKQPKDLNKSQPLESSGISPSQTVSSDNHNPIDLDKAELPTDTPAQLDLSQYCFIRNHRLLNADLVVPQEYIAQIVNTFHNFDESIKRSQLPILEIYFKDGQDPDNNDFDPEINTWWAEIQGLESKQLRKLAIWLSRYCLEPATAIATVETVFEAKAAAKKAAEETAKEKARQEKERPQSDPHTSYQPDSSGYNSSSEESQQQSKFSFDLNSGFVLPNSWILVTLAIIVVGINSAKSTTSLPAICEDSSDREYCQLAVQIVGEKQLETASQNAPELKEESINIGSMYCEVYGNTAAGIPLRESDPQENPPLYTDGVGILPGIYVADVEQTNTRNGNPTVRTVCILEQTKAKNPQRSINILNTEQIDPDWPEIPYETSERINSIQSFNQAMNTYSTLGWFGLNTFYTAISIYVVAICGMAIKAYSLQTIYQASFVLGIVEAILASLPVLGLWIFVAIECVALGITSACVKGFKVDWAAGYHFVAASALLLIGIRALLCWSTLAFLWFILS
ncbi:MAG: hypothetical protein ACFCAD_09795 [Pleurocapsa sp.]